MIWRELHSIFLYRGSLFATFAFFILALFAVSLAIGPHEAALRQSAPGLIWILAMLTTFFSTPLLLKREQQQGLLDEVALHPSLPAVYILSKILAEGIALGIPLMGIVLLMAPLFSLSLPELVSLVLSLGIGFPALSVLGLLGGLLTLPTQGGGLLVSLVILPLALPLLIFGLSAMEMTRLGLDSSPSFCLLTGTSLFLVILGVVVGHWAFSFAVER